MILSHSFDENDHNDNLHSNYTKNGLCRILQGHSENMGVFVRIKGNVLVTFIQSKLHK